MANLGAGINGVKFKLQIMQMLGCDAGLLLTRRRQLVVIFPAERGLGVAYQI
jgi:hypothetical protein